jgi:hypothetical protein
VDSAPETIRIAKERIPEGIVQFVVGDAYALPVHLGEFSADSQRAAPFVCRSCQTLDEHYPAIIKRAKALTARLD